MDEVTRILQQIQQGDPQAARQLLPLVYVELRRLARHKLAQERPGQTLQATALVHEAYLRLVGHDPDQHWDHRGHFPKHGCAGGGSAASKKRSARVTKITGGFGSVGAWE